MPIIYHSKPQVTPSPIKMQSHLSSCLFLLIVIFFLVAPTSLSFSIRNEEYKNCSQPFRCSSINNIGYPFWGYNRQSYCGLPGFQLDCQADVPEITIMRELYRVLGADDTEQTLTLARDDLWNNICPTLIVNTTLDYNIFNYTSDTQSLVLYYNCPSIPVLSNSMFTCDTNGTNITNYYVTNNFMSAVSKQLTNCSSSIVVYTYQHTVQGLENGSMDLVKALKSGFGLKWITNRTVCDECSVSGGQCGYNSSTNRFACQCPDQAYASRCPPVRIKTAPVIWLNFNNGLVSTVFGLAMAGITYLGIAALCSAMCKCCRERKDNRTIEEFIRSQRSLGPQRYSYSQVKKMTKSFKHKLGQGGYGAVYRGKLPDGRLVAVKVLRKSKENGEDFINEVSSISKTSHVNVVTLLGFCYDKNRGALVYEFMPNGSLDKYIYDENTNQRLEWNTLHQISIGIARGLEYLHLGCNTRILHFDIKPHNILLDENFHPKISDFGLAKLSETKDGTMSTLGARGTIGYIAPEVFCRIFGGVSHKSDVYSYGMMVLEMVGGRKNFDARTTNSSEQYFPDWVYKQLEQNENVRVRGDMTDEEEENVRKMILVSLWCIQTNPSDRPTMSKVVEMLVGNLQSLPVPPKPSESSSTVFSQATTTQDSPPTTLSYS